MHLENNMDVFCLDKKDKISLYSSIPRKKGLTDICEAFWQWKRTYHRAGIPPCPSFCSWPLCSLFSIFQCTEAKQPPSIPSLLLHGWAPAGFLRGLLRCCFYMDSHGGGEEVSGRERLHIVSTRLFYKSNI